MATVIGVRFKKAGKVYYFDPCDFWPKPGQNVVVETARGIEFGEVVTSPRSVSDQQIVAPLKKVVRIATEEDEQRAAFNARREEEAFKICQEKVLKHKLEMKLVSVEYTFDNSKIIFYFTANGRVDFRELVKDLASVFKMRIELRQIGVRDEAKMLGGLGSCGRPICCGAFLGDFQPVSIKMAKEQNLSLNPTKISGLCGRLMCCLKYEQDNYEEARKRLPRVGRDVLTPDGRGHVIDVNVLRETVRVRFQNGDNVEVKEYSADDVKRIGAAGAASADAKADAETDDLPPENDALADGEEIDDLSEEIAALTDDGNAPRPEKPERPASRRAQEGERPRVTGQRRPQQDGKPRAEGEKRRPPRPEGGRKPCCRQKGEGGKPCEGCRSNANAAKPAGGAKPGEAGQKPNNRPPRRRRPNGPRKPQGEARPQGGEAPKKPE